VALSRMTIDLPQFREVVCYLQTAFEKHRMIRTNA